MRGLLALCFILGVCLLAPHSTAQEEEDDDAHAIADGSSSVSMSSDADTPDDDVGDGDEEEEESVWTEQQISSEQIRKLHQKADANSDGKVSLKEVMDFATTARQAIVAKETSVLLDSMDTNKDGKLSLDELISGNFGPSLPEGEEFAANNPEQVAEDERIKQDKELEKQKFKVADKDGDGFLNKDELPSAFYPETHDGVLSLTAGAQFKRKDKDGDGQLTSEEFWVDESEVEEAKDNAELAAEQQADFEKLDVDKNGKVDLEEYKKWESGAFNTADAMTHLFEIADEDSDEHLTAHELDSSRDAIANSMATSHMLEWVVHYEL